MWSGGTDYGLTAGDDDTTSYHQFSCLEPVFDKPNEPKYTFLAQLHHLLARHEGDLLGNPPPAPTLLPAATLAPAPAPALALSDVEVRHFGSGGGGTSSITFLWNPNGGAVSVLFRGRAHVLAATSHLIFEDGSDASSYNTSAVAGNNSPPYTVVAVTTGDMQWRAWQEPVTTGSAAESAPAPAFAFAPVPDSGAGRRAPVEQVQLNLAASGGQLRGPR